MALWTPSNLATAPVEWFSGDSGVTTSGGNVTAVTQRGSLSGNLAVPGGWTGPTQGSLNSLATFAFSGSASIGLESGSTRNYTSGALTFYIVAKRTAGRTGSYDVLCNTGAPWTSTQGFCNQYDTGSTGIISMYGGNGYGGSAPYGQTTNASGPAQDGKWHVLESHAKATTIVWAFDANNQTLSASSAGASPTLTGYLFELGFNPDGNFLGGEIAEIIILNYEPTSGENAQIQGYLAWKWGNSGLAATDLVGNLPGGHTYKSAAPTVSGTQTITGALFTNTQTFFAAVVNRGAVNISGGLFTDTDTFFGAVVKGLNTITGALYTDTDSFFGAVVSIGPATISGGLFTNSNTFFGATLGGIATINGGLYSNNNLFYAAAISQGGGGGGVSAGTMPWLRRRRRNL